MRLLRLSPVGGSILPRLRPRRFGVGLTPVANMKTNLTFLGVEGRAGGGGFSASTGARDQFHGVSIADDFKTDKGLDVSVILFYTDRARKGTGFGPSNTIPPSGWIVGRPSLLSESLGG